MKSGAFFAVLALGALAVLLSAPSVCVSGPSDAPYSGMEGGPRHAFGPDSEETGKADKRVPIPTDAYGNPLTGEEAVVAPRDRPGAGAYGGYDKRPRASRPLPTVEGPAKWHFR